MADQVHGLPFVPPEGFLVSEVMVSLKAAPRTDLKDPRVLQPQHSIRPNLIVHRREIPAGANVDMVCGEICAELVNSIEGMKNLATERFSFLDGASGRVVSFDFPAGKAATVRQYQALRLDDCVLTTLTLTVDATTLTHDVKERYLTSLASAGSGAA